MRHVFSKCGLTYVTGMMGRNFRGTGEDGDEPLWGWVEMGMNLSPCSYEGRSKSFATWHDNVKMSMHGMYQ